jgi:hypothetical protein
VIVVSQLDEITADLHRISDRLAELSIDLLTRAVDTVDEPERVMLANRERRVAKARRAVEKALHDLTDER